MSQPRAEFEEHFVFAPSFLIAEEIEEAGEVFEGKAIGTAAFADLALAKDQMFTKDADPKQYANERKKGQTVGKRKLGQVMKRTRTGLLREIKRFQGDKMDEKVLRKEAAKVMRTAWRDVFLAGLRAGGTPGEGAGKGKVLVKLDVGDDKWFKSAVQHEMRFLNGFLNAIIDETYVMPLNRRVKMYLDALASFYESARVIAFPTNTLMWWKGPHDKRTCASCAYLFENSPYTKLTLPTTPRSGLTICLCLSSGSTLTVVRSRGRVPLQNVKVGDEVWTHRNRWRRVTETYVNRSVVEHRYAVLVGPDGELTGVTSDHLGWTPLGWASVEQVAHADLRILPAVRSAQRSESPSPLSVMCIEGGMVALSAQGASPNLPMLPKAQGEYGDVALSRLRPAGNTAALRGLDRGAFPSPLGRALPSAVLGRRSYSVCAAQPLAVGTGTRSYSEGLPSSPRESRLCRRQLRESGVFTGSEALQEACTGSREVLRYPLGSILRGVWTRESKVGREGYVCVPALWDGHTSHPKSGETEEVLLDHVSRCGAKGLRNPILHRLRRELQSTPVRTPEGGKRQCFLLKDLLAKVQAGGAFRDPAVRLLWEEFQEAPRRLRETTAVEAGEVLLLGRVLPEGSSLYDLEVAEDHSFVAGGLILHNSNCRDHLFVRRIAPERVQVLMEGAVPKRDAYIRKLRKIKREGRL